MLQILRTADFDTWLAALRDKITAAFLALDRNDPQGKEVLALQRATRFVATKADNYKGIEQAARSAGLLK